MFWTGHFRYLPWKVIETVRGSTWTLKQSFVDFLDTLPNIWLKMETIVFHIFSDINFLDPPAYQGSTGGKSESFQDQQQKWGESFFAVPILLSWHFDICDQIFLKMHQEYLQSTFCQEENCLWVGSFIQNPCSSTFCCCSDCTDCLELWEHHSSVDLQIRFSFRHFLREQVNNRQRELNILVIHILSYFYD